MMQLLKMKLNKYLNMRILKDVVKSMHNTSFNGILIELKSTSRTLYESIYDYEFDIGDLIET